MDGDKEMMMSQMNFEKRFGQSAAFVTSTFMEEGGVPPSSSPAALLKEAIHVISCGYEDKTDWGLEVQKYHTDYHFDQLSPCYRLGVLICVPSMNDAAWVDLWVNHRGHLDRIQDALPWVAVDLLHAQACRLQGVGADQSV
jgi:hypothetical protein